MEFTSKVQVWRNGVMITAQMTAESAKKLVQEGKAKAINSQAITMIQGES